MLRQRATFLTIVAASLALAMALTLAIPVLADCNYYDDSEAVWFWGYGMTCAGNGYGCQVCYNTQSGRRCVSGAPYRCGPLHDY